MLPREVFAEVIVLLRAALPPPVVDRPGEWARRDRVAMAAVQPATAAEGRLAAQFVAADAYAMDCLRLANAKRREPEQARKCAAQAAAMMRESKSALRVLLRLQAVRRAMSADEVAASRAEWAEHAAVGLMAEVLRGDVAEAESVEVDVQKSGSGFYSEDELRKLRGETVVGLAEVGAG